MATKINTAYYGAANTWVEVSGTNGNIKTENYSINDHIIANDSTKWDIENGATPDTTASPWGIGRSSLSSYGYAVLTCVNRGTNDNYGGNLRKKVYEINKGNTPITFVNKSGMIYAPARDYARNWVRDNKRRFVGKTRPKTDSNSAVLSTNAVDNGEDIYTGDRQSSGKTVTYADYQQLRYRMGAVGLVKISGNNIDFWSSGIKDLPNLISRFPNEDYVVFGENNWIGLKGSSSASYICATVGVKTPVPEWLHQLYFDDDTTEWLPFNRSIDSYIGSPSYNSLTECRSKSTYRVEDLESGTKYADFAQQSLANGGLPATWVSASNYKQVFNDVSYHWDLVYFVNKSGWNEVNENQSIPATVGSSYNGRFFMKLVIDDSIYDNYYTACYYALLHEAAFLGLPFSDSYYGEESIGDTHVFLPVFNDHMVTTGDYKSGADSLELPNATWGDIFGADMPEYNPTYDPDVPPEPDDDYGYLDNKPITNRVYSSNNRVYALTAAQYSQFIQDINSLYLDDPETGYASFQLDFKGTNPSDYIVGTYGYTFLPAGLIPNQQPEAIQIGAVTLPNAQGYKIAPSYIYNYRSLGEIDLTGAGDFKPFGDFRDFEPYTHIELYIPLCGNIELDPATVVGHTIQIDIIFDIMSGNATACVYRDNQTLIATVAGQLAASLPLTSGRMGDYQNAVKSAENALKQNELKTATAAATVAMGVGAALLAPETGGLSLAAYGAALTGGASLMSLSNQKNQIEYEINHKQPSISVCSSANGAVAQNISSMYAVCYVKQCKMLSSYNAATYAHTVGHATVKNTTIGAETTDDRNSLIVCSNADLSGIPATAAEINAIQSLLTGGVYV